MPLPQTGRGLEVPSGMQKTINPNSFDYLFHWPDGVTRRALSFLTAVAAPKPVIMILWIIKQVGVNFMVNKGIACNKLARSIRK
jgi:hypothetical protein